MQPTTPTILLLDDASPLEAAGFDAVIELSLAVDGRERTFHLGAMNAAAGLADLVPPAQAISDRLGEDLMDRLAGEAAPVTCRDGCSACCYYLVTLSRPEVFYYQALLASLPVTAARTLLQSCLDAAERILSHRPDKPAMDAATDLAEMSRWYQQLSLACPFLSQTSCEIYPLRPLACREYLVTSPARHCDSAAGQEPAVVTPPVSLLEALARLAGDCEGTEMEGVMLPLAFIAGDEDRRRSGRRWDAVELVRRFAAIVEDMAAAQTAAPAATARQA